MPRNPRLDAAYVAQVKQIRGRVEGFTQARFAAGQYRDVDLERFVREVVPVVQAGRLQVSALTDAYLSRVLTSTLGRSVPPRGPIDTKTLRGVDATEVYARPYVTVRTKLANGLDLNAAISAGTSRLTDLVMTDMQLAKTTTAQSMFSETEGVTRFARVLSGGNSCALCYLASDQTYSRGDLLPIHPGCDCGVEPLTDDSPRPPSQVAEVHESVSDLLGASDSSGRDAGLNDPHKDYSKVVIVRHHGEIGPLLAIKGQHFAGPSSIT